MNEITPDSIIKKAEDIYFSENNLNLLDFLQSHIDVFEQLDKKETAKYNHLLAFAFLTHRKLNEAESLCHTSLKNENYPLDYYFILTAIHHALKEYSISLKFAEQFITLFSKIETSENNYSYTQNHLGLIYNFLGKAFMQQHKFEEAISAFTEAIAITPDNQLPYLNLVNLYIYRDDTKNASIVLKSGLKNCPEQQELQIISKSIWQDLQSQHVS